MGFSLLASTLRLGGTDFSVRLLSFFGLQVCQKLRCFECVFGSQKQLKKDIKKWKKRRKKNSKATRRTFWLLFFARAKSIRTRVLICLEHLESEQLERGEPTSECKALRKLLQPSTRTRPQRPSPETWTETEASWFVNGKCEAPSGRTSGTSRDLALTDRPTSCGQFMAGRSGGASTAKPCANLAF